MRFKKAAWRREDGLITLKIIAPAMDSASNGSDFLSLEMFIYNH